MRFEGMAESIGPMLVKPNPGGGTGRLPLVGPVTQAKERVGRTTLLSSSAMSSDRLFLDRVARQHCPSPLHRHPQITTHSSQAQAKGDISTLLGRGHFYFALTSSPRPLDTVHNQDVRQADSPQPVVNRPERRMTNTAASMTDVPKNLSYLTLTSVMN